MGESYDGIRALADSFALLKYPTTFLAPLPGNGCCSNFEPSWSSYLFFFKKNSYFFSFLASMPPSSSSSYLFCFLYLYLHPRYPWKVILVHTFQPFWVSFRAILFGLHHPAMRFIPEIFPCQGNLQGVFTEEYTSTLTTML